ncbi:FAD-binding protein [Clostridium ljungdahlii]|uniref:FAD-binding protein n=1 Tax=Clostridium ljungdahlii TaxID=1538 RepID=UPI00386B7E3D
MIDEFDCTKCGICIDECPNNAIVKVNGKTPKLPTKLTRVKGSKNITEEDTEKKKRHNLKRHRTKLVIPLKKDNNKASEKISEIKKSKEGTIMKKMETDIIIAAGGPAGLAAAITAGENNLKSILFEKSSTTGGAANMGMGPLGIDTKIQKDNFNNISVAEALDMHMKYTHYRVDEDLVQTYFNKSAETIEWLQDMGVEFAGAFRYFKESAATWHIVKPENGVIGPRAASGMAKIMTERAKELGTKILLETPVVSLIKENGRICGVKAQDSEGNIIEVRAKAVIVATGGFGNNKNMIKSEFGLTIGEDYFPFMVPGITGDGLKMMWEAGAMKYGENIEAIYQLPDNLNWFLLDAVLRQPNLLINQLGDRFMNEGDMGNTTFTGNAIAMQPGNYAYCIMDEGILKHYKKNGPDIFDIVHPADAFLAVDGEIAKAVEQGYESYFEARTVEELAKKLNIDAEKLQDTIDEYNEACETGVDTKFHKNRHISILSLERENI